MVMSEGIQCDSTVLVLATLLTYHTLRAYIAAQPQNQAAGNNLNITT